MRGKTQVKGCGLGLLARTGLAGSGGLLVLDGLAEVWPGWRGAERVTRGQAVFDRSSPDGEKPPGLCNQHCVELLLRHARVAQHGHDRHEQVVVAEPSEAMEVALERDIL